MNILIIVLTVIDAMVALLLIVVVLVQQSKDGGLGGAPFGGAGDSVFGAQAADHLTKLTVALATIFLLLTLSLAVITGRRTDDERGIVDDEGTTAELSAMPEDKKMTEEEVQKKDQEILDTLGGTETEDVKKPETPEMPDADKKSEVPETSKKSE